MEHHPNPRRQFLVNVGKTTVVAAAGAGVLATSSLGAQAQGASAVVKGRSKKVEVLYQKTRHWEDYYKNAY